MDAESLHLLSNLQLHNDYFKRMTDLIPARYYFEQENKHAAAGSGKFFHNSREKAPKQSVKDNSKKKANNKRQRLDPTQHRSVTDIQLQMDQGKLSGKEGVATSSRVWREKSEDESESDAMATGLEDLSDDSEVDVKSSDAPAHSRLKPMSVESVTGSATIDELREKVRQRIEQLRTKRKAKPALPENTIPKKVARKEAEKEKKKKLEAIKAVKAAKTRDEALEKATQAKMVNGGSEEVSAREEDSDGEGNRETSSKKKSKSTKRQKTGSGKNAGGEDVSFSHFDFAENEREAVPKKRRKKVTEPRSNKDYGRLLKKAEYKEQKLKEMKEKDPDQAHQMETESKWQTVIDRAQGIKVKDDVELLKKSLKRKGKRKQQSSKQWEARTARLEEKMKEREARKRRNVKAKTDARKSKKVKRLQRKGKLLLQD
ncbi:uncharacterized protein [Diadema antillarum]|uniref:uncharacterized protein n=1 Tax=Diadema antillarum TaxID=105358 RepID=UPI003A89F775